MKSLLPSMLCCATVLMFSSSNTDAHYYHHHRHRHRYAHVHSDPSTNEQATARRERSPALYRISKTTAAALGIEDTNLIFSPYIKPEYSHTSREAPWAGSLVY
jgi:hypothetical protein